MSVRILIGDVREQLRLLPADHFDCVVTSPPYWGLRDYGVAGQLGMEATYQEHVTTMADVFDEVRRVMKPTATLWLNYGDSYASSVNGRSAADVKALGNDDRTFRDKPFSTVQGVLKPKDLCGIPWRVAFALQERGWHLRQDIIWSKPNPMPESVVDRCTKAHEYIFLMSKSARYYYDQTSIMEKLSDASVVRLGQNVMAQRGSDRVPGKTNGNMKAVGNASWNGSQFHTGKTAEHQLGRASTKRASGEVYTAKAFDNPQSAPRGPASNFGIFEKRNKRSVWEVATQPFSEAHFATFPPALIEPCIKAGCPVGGMVLDPFGGAGTTGLVADRLQRHATLIELNPEYAALARRRVDGDAPLFAGAAE